MTNVIIKGHRYRLIDNKSFEMPLPLKYVVLKEDNEIAKYEVAADESVSYTILTKYKEEMITPINRPFTIADVYYFFSCRVFQDKTPFTYYELSRLGLEKYNVYNIIRKTRGITPYDTYWIRFEGDCCDYETARKQWEDLMSKADSEQDNAAFAQTESAVGTVPAMGNPDGTPAGVSGGDSGEKTSDIADINEILHQQKVDVSAAIAEHAPPPEDEYSSVPKNSTMSAEEIEQLLIQSGLAEAPIPAPEPEASSGGNLSPDEIEKLFAANAAEETPEPTPAPATSSGGNLSPDEIAKLFAANSAEETPAPAPAEPAPSSGGNLSPDEIAKLFAANAAEETPAPAPEPAPAASSGGNLSPDEIAKLFAANAAEETPAPAEPAPATSSGGNLSPDEIAKLFAANAAEETPAPAPEPAPAASSGGNLSPDEIEKLFAANAAAETSAPEPTPAPTSSGKMSQEDIEKMLSEQVNAVSEPIDINAPTNSDTDSTSETADSGERLSPEEIEALLGDMKKDAQT
ncbi:MAG: hypothetical protein ACI4JS_10010 [Oscillospiraceae bacterium]